MLVTLKDLRRKLESTDQVNSRLYAEVVQKIAGLEQESRGN